jgi:MFS family permease
VVVGKQAVAHPGCLAGDHEPDEYRYDLIFVLFAQERLGLGSVGYGVLLTSIAVGGVAGSLTAERFAGWLGAGTTMRIGLLIEAVSTGVIALSREPLVVGAMLALFGFHAIVWNVVTISLRQQIIPEHLLGRVISVYRLLGLGGMSVGALLGGVLARGFGLTAPFWFASFSVAILAVVTERSTIPLRLALCDRVSIPLPLLVYSPECLEGDFCELRAEGSKTLNRQGYKTSSKR